MRRPMAPRLRGDDTGAVLRGLVELFKLIHYRPVRLFHALTGSEVSGKLLQAGILLNHELVKHEAGLPPWQTCRLGAQDGSYLRT